MQFRRAASLTLSSLVLVASLSGQSLRGLAMPSEDGKGSTKSWYRVLADGNLKDVLGKKEGASSPSGSLAITLGRDKFIGSFLVNAVGVAAPLEKDFGSSLLAPASGSGLSAGLAELRYQLTRMPRVCSSAGLRLYGSVSSARWKRSEGDSTHIGVVVPGAGAGLYCEFMNFSQAADPATQKEERSLAIAFDAAFALRAIAGDIATAANDTLRTRILTTKDHSHWGIELGLSIQYNGLKAGLTYYRFPGEIPGFSRGQVVAGFSVETALAKGVFE